jgi:hypothetical protein
MSSTVRTRLALLVLSGVLRLYAQSSSSSSGSTAQSGATAIIAAPPLSASATRIESEVVTVTGSAAWPNEIKRSPGKFFLVLTSKTKTGLPALVFDSLTVPAAQVTTLTQGLDLTSFQPFRNAAGLLDLPSGEYHLKSQATGNIFLKIVIQ